MIEKRNVKKALEVIKVPNKDKSKIYVYSSYANKKNVKALVHSTKNGKIELESELVFSYSCEAGAEYSVCKKKIAQIFKKLILEDKLLESEIINLSKTLSFPNFWFNSRLEKDIKVVSNAKNYNQNYNQNNDNYSDYKKANSIKPIYLLEILEQLNYINVEEITPNTSGEEFWKYTINNSFSNNNFKTSVKTRGFIENNSPNYKFDIFNDVYNSSKGYGNGSIGLISYLGSHGLFKEPLRGKENEKNRKERAVKFIIDNIYKYVDKNNLINNDNKNNNQIENVDISNYSRLPFKKSGTESALKNYLIKQRKIGVDLVDKIIKEGLLYGGYFSQNSFQDGHKLFLNQYFFKLTDYEQKEVGAERFNLYEDYQNNIKVNKLNISSVSGKAFRLNGDKSKVTIFTEAIIDALSVRELLSIAGIDPDYFNIYSIQGCPHFNNWMKLNLGIGFELMKENQKDYGSVYKVDYKQEIKELSASKIASFKKTLSNTDFYFIKTNSIKSNAIYKNIEALNEICKLNIIEKNNREDFIDYNKYNSKSIFLDETNFEKFLLENNLTIVNDNKPKLAQKNIIEVKSKINKEDIIQIKERMKNVLGCENIALAFDNDHAGLKYVPLLKELEKTLGIKTFNMIPQNIKKDTDCNDVLKKYHELKENNEEQANKILIEFVSKIIPNYEMKKKQNINQLKNKI